MNVSLPIINFAGETTLHGEFNLAGEGGLALEVSGKKNMEEALKSDQARGVSRMATAQALSVHYAKYVEPMSLGGFYWGVGAGYRRESIDWVRPRDPQQTEFAAIDSNLWQAHSAELSGPTAHGRIGYRYVGKEMPLLIGVFSGLRHFASTVKDKAGDSQGSLPRAMFVKGSSASQDKVTGILSPVTATEMAAKDKTKLHNVYATRLEGGIEVGFSF